MRERFKSAPACIGPSKALCTGVCGAVRLGVLLDTGIHCFISYIVACKPGSSAFSSPDDGGHCWAAGMTDPRGRQVKTLACHPDPLRLWTSDLGIKAVYCHRCGSRGASTTASRRPRVCKEEALAIARRTVPMSLTARGAPLQLQPLCRCSLEGGRRSFLIQSQPTGVVEEVACEHASRGRSWDNQQPWLAWWKSVWIPTHGTKQLTNPPRPPALAAWS